jgi:uncharacterized protein YaeQ
MALTATPYRFHLELSDVDRGVYETLDVRMALHPSETLRYLLVRLLAYALSYEEGIAFSKGGISSTEEPPLSVRDATGRLLAWIDVGAPAAERLHKATKAAPRVALFTSQDLAALRKAAGAGEIHRADGVELWQVEPALLTALEPLIDRTTRLALLRSDGRIYVTVGAKTHEGAIERGSLVAPR